jgi:hypothetical protein
MRARLASEEPSLSRGMPASGRLEGDRVAPRPRMKAGKSRSRRAIKREIVGPEIVRDV